MSILEQKRVKRSNFGQSKIACRDMDSSCRSMRCIPTKNQRSTCRSMSWPGRSMSRRWKEGKFKSGRSMTNPCRDMTTFMSFYFWQLGLKRTPIVILICSYKKEVIDTFWRHLAIYFLLNLLRLLREFVRKSLGTWRRSIEDLFHQLYWLHIFFFSSISFIRCLLLILWIVLSKIWVAKFL